MMLFMPILHSFHGRVCGHQMQPNFVSCCFWRFGGIAITSQIPYTVKCYSSSWETHFRATQRHLSYAITQYHLPPDTGKPRHIAPAR